jgi:hypothetical protein
MEKQSSLNAEGISRLGTAILSKCISCAFVVLTSSYTCSPAMVEEYKSSLVIIQGSGLDNMVSMFGISINTQKLREGIYDRADEHRGKKTT